MNNQNTMLQNLDKKRSFLILGIAAAILLLALGAAVYFRQKIRDQASSLPGGGALNLPTPSPGIVVIKNYNFVPSRVPVKKGEIITFINEDAVPHTVTSEALGGRYDIPAGRSLQIDTSDIRFPSGEISYHCDLSPYMRGTIALLPAENQKIKSGFQTTFETYSPEIKSCIAKALGDRLPGFLDGTIKIPTQDEMLEFEKCL